MCFSSTASFVAAGVLIGTGVATLSTARNTPAQVFAAIPFLFGIQQIAEGMLWFNLGQQLYLQWQPVAIYTFLYTAQVIWPVWIPLSLAMMEKKKVRKRILWFTAGVGILFAAYIVYCLINYTVWAKISDQHIVYHYQFPKVGGKYASVILYLIATVIPFFISGARRMALIGFTVLVSFAASKIFYPEAVVSVWCYFAAALSMLVLYALVPYARTYAEDRRILKATPAKPEIS